VGIGRRRFASAEDRQLDRLFSRFHTFPPPFKSGGKYLIFVSRSGKRRSNTKQYSRAGKGPPAITGAECVYPTEYAGLVPSSLCIYPTFLTCSSHITALQERMAARQLSFLSISLFIQPLVAVQCRYMSIASNNNSSRASLPSHLCCHRRSDPGLLSPLSALLNPRCVLRRISLIMATPPPMPPIAGVMSLLYLHFPASPHRRPAALIHFWTSCGTIHQLQFCAAQFISSRGRVYRVHSPILIHCRLQALICLDANSTQDLIY
jgi:hypothetical protein